MIATLRDDDTESLFKRRRSRKYVSIERVAFRKLRMLNQAGVLADLRNPPGNHLEALRGNRNGQCSIRINDQWRICFEWRDENAYEVEIVDYH